MPLFFMIYRFSETESPCAGRAVNPALQYYKYDNQRQCCSD